MLHDIKMVFITKNANLFLLFLIVLASIGLVAATIFFQYKFQNVNQRFVQKVTELQDVNKELEQKRTLLESIQLELSQKTKREEEFTGKYSEVKEEKELFAKKAETLEEKADILEGRVGDLQRENNKLDILSKEQAKVILNLQNEIVTLRQQNLQYQVQISNLANQLISCQASQG